MRLPSLPAAQKEFIETNLYSLLAVGAIILIVLGYAIFFFSSINPGLQTRSSLTTQLADARRTLADAKRLSAESPDSLRARLQNAKATLAVSSSYFLGDAQLNGIIDALYQYAAASQVTIAELQTQPIIALPSPTPTRPPPPTATQPAPTRSTLTPGAPTSSAPPQPTATRSSPTQPAPTLPISVQPQKDAYRVTVLRLQVRGPSRQLVEFVSRIKEASASGFIISNLNIAEIDGKSTLTMDISLYTTPSGSGSVLASVPPTSNARATLATNSPLLSSGGVPNPSSLIVDTITAPAEAAVLPTTTRVSQTRTPIPITPTPTPKYVTYTVRAGDDMSAVARQYGTTVQAIMLANRLTDFNFYAGQQLHIPVP